MAPSRARRPPAPGRRVCRRGRSGSPRARAGSTYANPVCQRTASTMFTAWTIDSAPPASRNARCHGVSLVGEHVAAQCLVGSPRRNGANACVRPIFSPVVVGRCTLQQHACVVRGAAAEDPRPRLRSDPHPRRAPRGATRARASAGRGCRRASAPRRGDRSPGPPRRGTRCGPGSRSASPRARSRPHRRRARARRSGQAKPSSHSFASRTDRSRTKRGSPAKRAGHWRLCREVRLHHPPEERVAPPEGTPPALLVPAPELDVPA